MANHGKKTAVPVATCLQEISAPSVEEPPERYRHKNGIGGHLDTISPLHIPGIDVSLLSSPSHSRQELEKLHSALSSFGCFMAINHGVQSSFLDKVRSVSKQFFALPMEEKQKYAREGNSREGYGEEIVYADNEVFDWNYRLFLLLKPDDQRQLRFWPQNTESFTETISEYTIKIQLIAQVILKAIAISLNLDDNCFLDKLGHQARLQSRFNLYPPCPRHDQVLGLKPHSDSSVITILLQDKEVEGLQIQKDGQWFRAPNIPEAFLINIGDQMEIMSNGLFKSPVHRAVINPERDRFSLAVFFSPDPDNDIEPVDNLVNETRPRRYKTVKNYVGNFFQHYQKGKRLIEDMKI